jgi:hypothetical protein
MTLFDLLPLLAFLGLRTRYWAVIIVIVIVVLALVFMARGRSRSY